MSFVWPTSHVGMLHPLGPAGSRERQQGEAFLKMAGLAVKGVGYAKAKAKFSVSHQQVETRKSLYEELGLLYVPAGTDQLVLTDAGRQIFELLGPAPPSTASDELRLRVDTMLCWAMARCQINRPQSVGSPSITSAERSACTLRPYATFWKALLDLGGEITFEEFLRVLSRVQRPEQYEAALDAIRAARSGKGLPKTADQSDNFRIYWNSHLTVSGSVLKLGAGDVFSFADERDKVIAEILRVQVGCELSDSHAAIRSRPWTSVHDYYNFAGHACPPYLASGTFRLIGVGVEQIVLLRNYALQSGDQQYFIEGGTELCELKLLTPCFHINEQRRVLRVDKKILITPDRVRVIFGLGRPINQASPLVAAWNKP
jgi:hypothetical protein